MIYPLNDSSIIGKIEVCSLIVIILLDLVRTQLTWNWPGADTAPYLDSVLTRNFENTQKISTWSELPEILLEVGSVPNNFQVLIFFSNKSLNYANIAIFSRDSIVYSVF